MSTPLPDTTATSPRQGPLRAADCELVAIAVATTAATGAALAGLKEQMKAATKRHKAASDELTLIVQTVDRARRGAAE